MDGDVVKRLLKEIDILYLLGLFMMFMVNYFSDKVYLSGDFLYPVSKLFTPITVPIMYYGGIVLIIGTAFYRGHLKKLFKVIKKSSPWMKFTILLSSLLFIAYIMFLGELLFHAFAVVYAGYIVSMIMKKHWLFAIPLVFFLAYAFGQLFELNNFGNTDVADSAFVISIFVMVITVGVMSVLVMMNKIKVRFAMQVFTGFVLVIGIYFLFNYSFVINNPEPHFLDDYSHPVFGTMFQRNCIDSVSPGFVINGDPIDGMVEIQLGNCGTQMAFFELPEHFYKSMFGLCVAPIVITSILEKKKKS